MKTTTFAARFNWKVPLAIIVITLLAYLVYAQFVGWNDAGGVFMGGFIILIIASIATWSVKRYSRIIITPTDLIVGTAHKIPLSDINFNSINYQIEHGLLVPGGRDTNGNEIVAPLIGGAYDVPLGWKKVPIQRNDKTWFSVAVLRPGDFLQALSENTHR